MQIEGRAIITQFELTYTRELQNCEEKQRASHRRWRFLWSHCHGFAFQCKVGYEWRDWFCWLLTRVDFIHSLGWKISLSRYQLDRHLPLKAVPVGLLHIPQEVGPISPACNRWRVFPVTFHKVYFTAGEVEVEPRQLELPRGFNLTGAVLNFR